MGGWRWGGGGEGGLREAPEVNGGRERGETGNRERGEVESTLFLK